MPKHNKEKKKELDEEVVAPPLEEGVPPSAEAPVVAPASEPQAVPTVPPSWFDGTVWSKLSDKQKLAVVNGQDWR